MGGEDCTLSRRLHRLLTPSVVVEEVVEEWDGVMLSQRPPGADAPIPDLAGERASDAPRADPVEEGGTGAEVGVGSMVVLGADTEREGGEDTAGERGAETEAQAGREAGEEVAAGEDAEAEAEAGAAGKEDPEQRGTLLCEEEETCAALVPRPPLSPPLPAPAPSVAALEPDSLTQIDPAVFSELGPDLQRELRLRLPAHRRPRPPLPSVAEDAPPPAGTLAHQEPASCLGHTRNSRPPGTDPSGETGTGATLEVHRGSAVEGLGLGGEPLGSKLREGSYTFMLQQLIRGKQRRGSLLPSRGTSVRSSVAGALLRWQVSPRAEHEAEDGDSAREQAEAEECRRVVVEYAQSVVTIDLEETRLLLRALRRCVGVAAAPLHAVKCTTHCIQCIAVLYCITTVCSVLWRRAPRSTVRHEYCLAKGVPVSRHFSLSELSSRSILCLPFTVCDLSGADWRTVCRSGK